MVNANGINGQNQKLEVSPQVNSFDLAEEEPSSSDLSLDCVTRTSNPRQHGEHPLIKLDTNNLQEVNDAKTVLPEFPVNKQKEEMTVDEQPTPQSDKVAALAINSSPAVIEMIDDNCGDKSPDGQYDDLLDIQEGLSEAISSAVRETDDRNAYDISFDEQHSTFASELANSASGKIRNDREVDGNESSSKKRRLTPNHSNGENIASLETMSSLTSSLPNDQSDVINRLQLVFQGELKQYEHYIGVKNKQAEEYRQQTAECFQKVKDLTESLDEQKLKYSSILDEYEVYKATQATRDLQLKHQKTNLENLSAEKINLEQKVSKLKLRLSELRNEVKMLNQNTRILQGKFQHQIEENETLQNEVNDLRRNNQQLQHRLNKTAKSNSMLTENYENLQKDYANLNEENKELTDECGHKKEEIAHLKTALEEKDAVALELQANLRTFQDVRQQSSKHLEERIDELTTDKQNLLEDLDRNKEYKVKYEENEQKLTDAMQEVAILSEKLDAIQIELSRLREDKENVQSLLEASDEKVESANDQLAIKSAEVIELTHDIDELKQSRSYLEESIKARENAVQEWKIKYEEKREESIKLSVELESLQFKNTNLEAEHLADLEQLHQEMTSLKDTLKESSDQIKDLTEEKDALVERIETLTGEKQLLQEDFTNAQKVPQGEDLHSKIEELQAKLQQSETETNKKLQLLAEDLYIQYSSKHEQKVKMLKKGYESKYHEQLEKLELENAGLKDELIQIDNKLQAERNEKQELLKLIHS